MRALTAVVAVVMLVVVGIAVFAMLNLRALIGAHRDQLVARVERIVGRPITVGAVVPSWWPLGIRLGQVTLGEDPAFGAGPFLVADGVIMSVRPWPLVHGRIEAAGVVLERPALTLRRNGEGEWNVASLGDSTRDGGADGGGAKRKERRHSFRIPLEWAIGVALSQVRDGTITIEDGRDGEAVQLVLRHVRLHADDVRLGAAARLRLEAAVFAADAADLLLDVRVPNLGERDVEHTPFTARLALTDADLGKVGVWVRRPDLASGRVGSLTLDAAGTLEALHASLDLRIDDPALRVGSVPVGAVQPATLQARVGRTTEALTIEMLRATLGGLVLQGHGEATEDPWRIALDVQSDSGGVAAVAVGGTTVEVSALDGRVIANRDGVALEPLHLTLAGVPLEARGWVTG
ncbi:MAG: AsmA family protein, partial [Candidatus Binatia bacterium]